MIPRTLEEKQDERARLAKKYRAHRRERWNDLIAEEPRLVAFKSSLRRMRDAREVIHRLADSWIRRAPPHVRLAGLQLIEQHSQRERRYRGLAPLDDPLPPRRNVFLVARELLAVR